MPGERRAAKPPPDKPARDHGLWSIGTSPMWSHQVRGGLTLPCGELRVEGPVAFAIWVLVVIVVFWAGRRAAATAEYYYVACPAVCLSLVLYLVWLELKGGRRRFRVAFVRRRRLSVLRRGSRRHAGDDKRARRPGEPGNNA